MVECSWGVQVSKTASPYTCQPDRSDNSTHRHTATNVSRGNIPVAHLATLPPDEEEEFVVKREREGAKNEVFLNLNISTKKKKKDCLNNTSLGNKYFMLFQEFSCLL